MRKDEKGNMASREKLMCLGDAHKHTHWEYTFKTLGCKVRTMKNADQQISRPKLKS